MMKKLLTLLLLILCISVFGQVPTYVPNNGLIGWWPFNGNANDESGNGNNGTVNGATLSSDRFGNINNAYSFNGNQYIDITSTNGLNSAKSISMSIWFNWTGPNSWSHQYFYQISPNPNATITIDNDGTLGINVLNCNCPNDAGISTVVTQNTWYHVALTYDLNLGLMKMYLNGVLTGTTQENIFSYFTTNNSGDRIGCYHFNKYFFNGKLDDAGLWNKALTQSEIQQLYNLGQTTYAYSSGTITPSINVSQAETTTYSGRVYDYYDNGSLKSMHNLLNGIYDGKVELYFEKLNFNKSDYIDTALIVESRGKLNQINKQWIEANYLSKELAVKRSNLIKLKFKNTEKFQKLLDKGLSGKLKGEKLLVYNEFKEIENQISINARLIDSYSLELKKISEFIKSEEAKPPYIPKISHEFFYLKGKQTGLSKSYFLSGDQMLQENFFDGVLEGEWITYYDGGKIKEKKQYSQGKLQGESISYFEAGVINEKKQYSLGKLQGEYISYFETGVIKEKKQYSNDTLAGDYLLNYENGTNKEVGTFRSNQKNGVWKYYFENGKIQQEITYKNDIKNGAYKSYYENGQLQIDVFYKNGLENGLYKSYFENGQLERKGTKNPSSLHYWKFAGDVVVYNIDGKLIKHFNAKMDGHMVNLISGSTTKINPNSSHKCQWCSRNFKGAGWIAFEIYITVKDGLLFPDNPEYEPWFCSKKCASANSSK